MSDSLRLHASKTGMLLLLSGANAQSPQRRAAHTAVRPAPTTGPSHEEELKCLRRFGTEVIPHFRQVI